MSNKYHVIPLSGNVTSGEWTLALEYKCIPFAGIRELIDLSPNEALEHVTVLWQGQRAHMFVMENGVARDQAINVKATRVYWNATMQRLGYSEGLYAEFDQPVRLTARPPRSVAEAIGDAIIVGPALLWEGGMQ